ncbi:hypothetical protein J437_LFUL000750 [Ladona fulva]|uniref:Uncharacterized protein n=1 Tax=Ladona fulva TaxID=123851 RepID=A0A8K0KR75_LADFU|nr:hypothetical protein J437_LFUL000750 [Ladona fulva]
MLMLGLEGAGKTTIAKGLSGELVNGVVPTIGFSTVSLMFKKLAVVLYDLGGGPGIRAIWDNYFADVSTFSILSCISYVNQSSLTQSVVK